MMKQFRTALFLVFVFTVVHFQSIIVDGGWTIKGMK